MLETLARDAHAAIAAASPHTRVDVDCMYKRYEEPAMLGVADAWARLWIAPLQLQREGKGLAPSETDAPASIVVAHGLGHGRSVQFRARHHKRVRAVAQLEVNLVAPLALFSALLLPHDLLFAITV